MAICKLCGRRMDSGEPEKELTYSGVGGGFSVPVCTGCRKFIKPVVERLDAEDPNGAEEALERALRLNKGIMPLNPYVATINGCISVARESLGIEDRKAIQARREAEARAKAAEEAALKVERDKEREEMEKVLPQILITSGFSFDGYRIVKYSGYISGDDVAQINRGTNAWGGAGVTNLGTNLPKALVKIRRNALQELREAAYHLGCNAIIGVDFDYITLEPETANIHGGTTYLPYVICVTANGNAVIIEKDDSHFSHDAS